MIRRSRLFLSYSLCLASSLSITGHLSARLPANQGRMIAWQTDFEKALDTAKTEKKILFVAINMAGERANDEMVRVHYRDSRILRLSRHCVNLFATADHGHGKANRFPGLSYDQTHKIEIRVRERFLGIAADKDVVAPQHLFISPEGKVLLSVPYQITVGELEWMFVEAITKMDPLFRWKLDGRARAPKRVHFGYRVPEAQERKAPSKEEVETILRDLRKGRMDYRKIADKIGVLIRSDNEEAIQYVEGIAGSRWVPEDRKIALIEAIGKVSPKPWFVIVEPFIGDRSQNVRKAAILAAGALGEPKAMKSLKRQLKKEKEGALQGQLLRAMATLSPRDRKVIATLKKLLRNKKSEEELRMHCIVAAGLLEDRRVVSELLSKALADPLSRVRSTAAYAIGIRRDKDLLENVRAVLALERDASVKHWLEAAVNSIEGSNEESFKDFLTDVVGD